MLIGFCPCGSQQPYQSCCGKYLSGKEIPQTAQQLMQSRYTAFARGNIDYLIATRHPSKRKFDDRIKIAQVIEHTQWLSLKIINLEGGQKNDTIGYVEFVALCQTDRPRQLHERSKFIKTDGLWFYLEGNILPAFTPKRNAPCWCGSGKKFKKCHGKSI